MLSITSSEMHKTKRECYRCLDSEGGLWLLLHLPIQTSKVNLINILLANFLNKSALPSFSLVTFWLCN